MMKDKEKSTNHGGARYHPPNRKGGRPPHKSKGLRTVIKKHVCFQPEIFDAVLAARKEGESLSRTVNKLLKAIL